MKIYKYWHKARQIVQHANGYDIDLVSRSGSNISEQDARDAAENKLQQKISRLQTGETLDWYEYGAGELCEEVLETIHDEHGNRIAALTRNRYGAIILNTATLFIADIDIKPVDIGDRFMSLFGRPIKDETYHRNNITNIQQDDRSLGFIVYRTKAGLRVIVTSRQFDPTSQQSQGLLEKFGSDRIYMTLCQNQQCFRARLTPKPWRCFVQRPPSLFPRSDEAEQKRFKEWLAEYERQSVQYKVCERVEQLGNERLSPTEQRIVDLHDSYVLESAEKPLA